uniref:NADH-quinone oxidoreductase subunit A n=1 Tax=Schlesneria paludicola TaxID=360056 RepID=A0A7C2NWH7_9PLAN
MTDLVGHFLIFAVTAVAALLAPLLLGKLLRPTLPTPQKDSIYECGEPTIGSSYVQFDLRFYTVALLFIIFDVEVVFFFPWASVYGSAMQLADTRLVKSERRALSERLLSKPAQTLKDEEVVSAESALKLGWTSLFDVLFFFGVLLVGFAYVWKRGDLNWVRAVAHPPKTARARVPLSPVAPQTTAV